MLEKQFKADKDQIRKSLMKIKGVLGTGFGYREKGGKRTKELTVRVYVKKKVAKKNLGKHAIPKSIKLSDGSKMKTDVVAIGKVKPRGFTSKVRPVRPGAVIGHPQGNFSGTLGAVATDNTNGKKVFIGANHVMANFNAASVGDAILQPGVQYGGTSADKIGTLLRFTPMNLTLGGINYVDAAVGKPKPARDVKRAPFCSPIKVKKQGAVGMLFAGSPYITIINPIDRVLSELDVSLPKTSSATIGMKIHACTAVSGYIQTEVYDIHVDLEISFNGVPTLWLDQIITAGGISDSTAGDSGAIFYAQ